MAVFLVIGFLAIGAVFIRKTGFIETPGVEVRGVLGDLHRSLVSSAEGAELDQAAVFNADSQGGGAFVNSTDLADSPEDAPLPAGVVLADQGSVKDLGQAVGPAFDGSGMISYTIQPNDNLSEIASYFGITVDTIIDANPGVKAGTLKPGSTLNILPTTGVIYTTQAGDTLASISTDFGIPQNTILQFNHTVNFSALGAGVSVIIPGGKNANLVENNGVSLPNLDANFIMPANGYDWGILQNDNAVDIANSCGTPVVAAADGVVVPDPSIPDVANGWNGGYGNFVLIEHPFGSNVETRYANLEQISAQIGDYVKQGQEIGLMGESGEATNCHVHFEVIGAHNPFAKS